LRSGKVIFTGAKSVVILVRWASGRTSNTAYSSSVKIIGNVFRREAAAIDA